MTLSAADERMVERVQRALWSLALDAWHNFDDEVDDDAMHAILEPLVLEAARGVGQAILDADEEASRDL